MDTSLLDDNDLDPQPSAPPAPRVAAPASAAAAEPKPTLRQRVAKLVADYEHGLKHNAPRHAGELNELKAVLQEVAAPKPAVGG